VDAIMFCLRSRVRVRALAPAPAPAGPGTFPQCAVCPTRWVVYPTRYTVCRSHGACCDLRALRGRTSTRGRSRWHCGRSGGWRRRVRPVPARVLTTLGYCLTSCGQLGLVRPGARSGG
jgi:hypothetical protein